MRIVKAKVLVDFIVRFWLDDGRTIDRDFSLVRGSAFKAVWRSPRKFRQVRVVQGSPTWPGDLDFAPECILRSGGRGPILKNAIVGDGRLLPARGVTSL